MNQTTFPSWQAPEYDYRHKHADWYWAVGIISLCTVITAGIYHNFLFAFFVAIATACLLYFGQRHPHIITMAVTKNGITVAGYLYPFKHIKAFWVDEDNISPKLIILSNRLIMPLVTIPLGSMGEAHRDELREVLLTRLTEREMPEPPAQKIMDYLGF